MNEADGADLFFFVFLLFRFVWLRSEPIGSFLGDVISFQFDRVKFCLN